MEHVPLSGLILLHCLQAHLPLRNADSSWKVVFISVPEEPELAYPRFLKTLSLSCHSLPDNTTFGILPCLLPLFPNTHLPRMPNKIIHDTLFTLITF